jgi:uncharacterized membrane protein YfcA
MLLDKLRKNEHRNFTSICGIIYYRKTERRRKAMLDIIVALLVGALIGFTVAAAVAVGTSPDDDWTDEDEK